MSEINNTELEIPKDIQQEPSEKLPDENKAAIFMPEIANISTELTDDAKKQMRDIYNIRPVYVNGMYLTPVQQANSYLVRLTFTEYNYTIGETVPVSGIILSLNDFINNYKLMTGYLNSLKDQGILK